MQFARDGFLTAGALTTDGELMKFAEMFMRPCLGASLVLVSAAPARARRLKLERGLRGRSAPPYTFEVCAETRKKKPTGEIFGMFS